MEFDNRCFAWFGAGRLASSNNNGVFGVLKGGRSPAQGTLDGIEKAFTLKGLEAVSFFINVKNNDVVFTRTRQKVRRAIISEAAMG